MSTAATMDRMPVVHLTPARFVTIDLASTMSGLTEKAIRRMIEDGVWAENKHYRRRHGRVFVDMQEFEKWVSGS